MDNLIGSHRKQKHVLICNERILFRYGVDRILVEMAKRFVAAGWRVTFACLRCDREVVNAITPHLLVPPVKTSGDLYDYESYCARFLDENWTKLTAPGPVDAIVSGGWPFFHVAALGNQRGTPTIFIDAGAVPHDGFNENQTATQRAVRRLRATCLPHFDRVLPISDFISESQTVSDRGTDLGVEIVRLGVDHLATKVFNVGTLSLRNEEEAVVGRLERLVKRNIPLVLALGRFEPNGYKNSEASFDLLRELLKRRRDADETEVRLLVLGAAEDVVVPADIESYVICLGAPSDDALIRIMNLASAGFSPSLWEGFNLPIGEMQILDKPVFAFNIGAHPEVILDPWFLCASIVEAAHKVGDALADRLPEGVFSLEKRMAYRETFSWKSTLDAYLKITEQVIEVTKTPKPKTKALLIDVSNSSRDTANSGVVRVTRRLAAQIQGLGAFLVLFVYWDSVAQAYRFVKGGREKLLALNSGPRTGFGHFSGQGGELTPERMFHQMPRQSFEATLLISEVVMDGEADNRIDWAIRNGIATAAILYDLIPIEHPNLCGAELCESFPKYIKALARVDRVMAISQYSLDCFSKYLKRGGLSAPPGMHVAWLPGQLAAVKRVKDRSPPRRSDAVSIVCVSTIEPRKNHVSLLAAYAQLRRSNPEINVRLTLIGNLYSGAEELATKVRDTIAADATIVWRGSISDEELVAEMHSAAFTVYPSLVEGFGLPILESLWMGKPCVCHNAGVMAELAAEGGCATVDMGDVDSLARTLKQLVEDQSLRTRLAEEAQAREIAVWTDYAQRIAALLGAKADFEECDANSAESTRAVAFREEVAREAVTIRHRLSALGMLNFNADWQESSEEPLDVIESWRHAPAQALEEPLAKATTYHSPSQASKHAESERVPAQSVQVAVRTTGLGSWLTRIVRREALTVEKVRKSKLFDEGWYLGTYPDVRAAGVEPIRHFVEHGHLERRSPGPQFDSAKYVIEHPDADFTNLSPFEHYLKYGGSKND